jgi:hypothetical protein
MTNAEGAARRTGSRRARIQRIPVLGEAIWRPRCAHQGAGRVVEDQPFAHGIAEDLLEQGEVVEDALLAQADPFAIAPRAATPDAQRGADLTRGDPLERHCAERQEEMVAQDPRDTALTRPDAK